MGRTVPSDEEDDEIEVDEEEDPRPSGGWDDGDDEGADGLDEYENDGFIVEEENVGGEEEQKSDDGSRKKKRESEDFILDEDDYSFLQNNNVTGISGPKPGNQFKRLKKAGVDELLARRKQGLEREASNSGELRAKRLEDEFEPFFLEEKSMTTKDVEIKENDLPERIQLSEELTGDPPTDNMTIEEESLWIHSQLSGEGFLFLFGNEQVDEYIDQKDIANVLTMLHVNKFEIPFIAMYRKEKCSSLLQNLDSYQRYDYGDSKMRWHKLLWAVQTLDRKWLLLQKRKFALELYYEKRFDDEKWRIEDVTRQKLNSQHYISIIEALKDAKSDKEVEDIDAKFNLHFPPVEVEEGQFKRPKKKSLYSIYHKAGLWEVANQFGRTSEQLGHRLTLTNIPYVGKLDSGKDSPEEVAANFTCAMFETPQDVLHGARHMAAIEISHEPTVRKHIRNIFMNKAVVSTCPTPEGNTIIDPYHQLSGVKWLREKPLDKFVDAQWLLIQKAEDEKLLKVTVKLPEDAKKELMSDACENYLSDCVSKSSQLWDEQRKMILADAFFSFLLPSMEKEARSLLTANAKHWLHMEYAEQLWNKVAVAPWKKNRDADIDLDDKSKFGVMACCLGPGKPAITFVMLDSFGELADVLHVGSIRNRSQGVTVEQKKKNDQHWQRVLKFMTDHQPHVVCLGASSYNCRQLKDDIYEVIFNIVKDHPRDVNPHMESLSIVYGDESVPRLYENSRISSYQLPGHSGIVKRAVALGRYLQNPLAMIATLCGPGKEILSWKLHALEHFLTPDEKYEVAEQVMVDATNQIGFDINLATSHEWHFSTLQFIAGLGPRKASALKKDLVRKGAIFSRKDLVEPLGRKVFMNASGFLRVRQSGAAAASAQIHMLEDTRIHPESYGLAEKLAKDIDIYSEDETDDDEQELAIERVREMPHMLQVLCIEEYIKSIPEEYRKKETLYDIRNELMYGFYDWRTPYIEPRRDEEFWMLSGETVDTISEGRIVHVTVCNIQENKIICMFDSGLKAIIMADDYSDEGFDPESSHLHEGDVLTGKIQSVDKNRFMVHLTCKASEMRRIPFSRGDQDPYYHEQDMTSRTAKDKARKQKELAKKHFHPRMIVHPHFKNLTAEEAMQFLSDKEPGEKVIRASSRGPSFFTLTLKIADGIYAHKEISEGGKDHKDIMLPLGKTLTVNNETFEDLDEVIDRFVDPLVGHLKSMLSHRKFRMGLQNEVDEMLRAEKAENPMKIAYSFGISHEYPGTFILSYIRGTNPHHEYVGLYPKGFRFRKRDFDNIDRLVSYFQKNIDKRPPDAEPSMQNVAAIVPMKNSACGSGGGAGDANDGWRRDDNYRDRTLSGTGRSGGRFVSRNSSGSHGQGRGRGQGNFGNEDGDGGNSGGWTSNIGSSRGGLGIGGNSGSSWGGVGTGGGSGGRNAAG